MKTLVILSLALVMLAACAGPDQPTVQTGSSTFKLVRPKPPVGNFRGHLAGVVPPT